MLSGCAYPTRQEVYTSQSLESGKSVVYVYRADTAIDSLNPDVPRFFVNGASIGRLLLGGYYRIVVDPGPVSVTYRTSLFGIPFFWDDGEVKFTAAEGKAYFVKFGVETIMRLNRFELVPDDFGVDEIKSTKHLVN